MRTAYDWSGSGSQRREQGVCLPPQPTEATELTKYRPKHVKRADNGRRVSWFDAIQNAQSNAELTAVGRTLSVMLAAGKLSEYQFARLVELGRQRRQSLARSNRQ